jgi:hypothetical protein
MAAKKTAAGFEFLVEALRADRTASYSDLQAKAKAKNLTVYPVMFGRAKALLGLTSTAKRGGRRSAASTARAASGKRRPGRPKGGSESKSGRIRELLKTGMSPAEIAKRVGSTVGLVYNVRSSDGGSARKVGRVKPGRRATRAPAGGSNGHLAGVVSMLQDQARERARLLRAIEQIRAVLDDVV